MARSVSSWAGSVGTAWPSLTINGGGTASWNADVFMGGATPPSTAYETLGAVLSGSSTGITRATINLGPTLSVQSATDRATDASTYLMPTAVLAATGDCTLIVVLSCHTAQHYHEVDINGSTGGWKNTGVVYTKVAETAWQYSTTYLRQTAWIVAGFSGATGQVKFQTSTAQGQASYLYSGGAYTAVGTAVTTQNLHAHFWALTGVASGSNYSAAIRTANIKYASGASGNVSGVTFDNNLSLGNNRVIAAFAKSVGANVSGSGYSGAGNGSTGQSNNTSPASALITQNALYASNTSLTDRKAASNYAYSAAWTNTTPAWGGFLLEIVDAATAAGTDTFEAPFAFYNIKTAATAQAIGEVRITNDGSVTRSGYVSQAGGIANDYGTPNPIARYCTVSAANYAVGVNLFNDTKNSVTTNYFSAVLLTDTTATTVIGTTSINATAANAPSLATLTKRAIRVENSAGGGLWVRAKAWSGATEPAWPATEATASSWTTTSVVLNVVDNATAGVLTVANAASGTNGVGFQIYSSGTRSATETYGSLSAYSDVVVTTGSATITGAGSLTASGAAVVSTSMPSSGGAGTGSLDASGVAIVEATVTDATGIGSLTVDGYAVTDGTSTASGTGDLSATGGLTILGDATLANTASTITTTEELVVAATATLTGAGTLTADAEVVSISIVTGTVTASGSGTLTADGYAIASETATISGTGTLSATPTLIAFTTTSPSGDGTLSGNGYGVLVDTATISGTGTLSADPAVTAFTTVSPHGTGSLTASPTLIATTNATSSGSGSLTAAGYAAPAAGAGLYGQGSLVATAKVIAYTDASLSGSSSGTTSGYAISATTVTATGTGSLASDATTLCVAQATCTGAGAAEAFANTTVVGDASLVGTSSGSVEATLIAYADAALQGVSSGVVTSFGLHFATAECSGVGSMVVDGKWVHYIPNTLRITQTRKVAEATFLAQPVMADGTPIYNGAQTTKKVNSGIFTTEPQEK